MAHHAKLEQYHKSIRKQELHSIFQQKRIQMMEDEGKLQEEERPDFGNLHDLSLEQMAKLCQTQEGIEHVYNLNVESNLQRYLKLDYLNTKQQNLATSILCNLYMIPRPQPPSYSFTEDVLSILEKGNQIATSNCVCLVFNIANDHLSWKQKAVRQHDLCFKLSGILEREDISRDNIINVLRTIVKILDKSSSHASFLCFFPKLVHFLADPCCNDNWIISHAYFGFYHLSIMFPSKALENISQHDLLLKFIRIAPLLNQNKFLIITLRLIELTLQQISSETVTLKVLPFVLNIVQGGYKGQNKKLKLLVCEVVINTLVQAKISAYELMQLKIGSLLVDHFSEEEDPEVLEIMVELFSIIILNIELCPLTERLERLFQRVELVCPHEIITIGFIKETQLKAKQRAGLYNYNQ